MDLLKDLKMSLLSFSFVMIYIIHKMLVLLKNHLNFLIYSNRLKKEQNYLAIKDIRNL